MFFNYIHGLLIVVVVKFGLVAVFHQNIHSCIITVNLTIILCVDCINRDKYIWYWPVISDKVAGK